MFGYARSETIGRDMGELLIPPALRDDYRRGLERYLASGEGSVFYKRLELTAIRASGVEFPVEVSVVPIKTEGEALLHGNPTFAT